MVIGHWSLVIGRMALRKAQMYYLQGFHHFGETQVNEAAIAN
ncbi:MAG: hypothetical protein V7K94_29440 [Nostoc sp.]